MSELSNSLADLAERVREAQDAAIVAQRQSIEKAFEAGFLLCQAKEQCAHGEWLPFLTRAGVHERQARRLMQIASCGLQIGHVSEIGGVRAALDYLSLLKLPPADDILFVNRKNPVDGDLTSVWIENDAENIGFYKLTAIKADGTCLTTSKPVLGDTMRCSDGYFNGVWCTLEMLLDVPHDERDFTMMPAELLVDVDDCPFLAAMDEPSDLSPIDVGSAPLPLSYQRVADALADCERELSEDGIRRLQRLMSICRHRSEKWPMGRKMLATYARIANEDQLSNRIDYLLAVAKLKWGALPSARVAS